MMADRFGAALRKRHLQRIEHQRRFEVMSHCPADDASGPHIQHDGEIQETRPGRHIGDVGDPESIRTLGAEAPVDLVQRAI